MRSSATSTSTGCSSVSSRRGSRRGRPDEGLAARKPSDPAARRGEGRGLVVAAHGSPHLDARTAGCPYKRRTALALVSLLAATVTALVPPYLAKLAIDDGIRKHNLHALTIVVSIF